MRVRIFPVLTNIYQTSRMMLDTLWVSNKYLLYEFMDLMIESLLSSHIEIRNFRLVTKTSTSQGHWCIYYEASHGKE